MCMFVTTCQWLALFHVEYIICACTRYLYISLLFVKAAAAVCSRVREIPSIVSVVTLHLFESIKGSQLNRKRLNFKHYADVIYQGRCESKTHIAFMHRGDLLKLVWVTVVVKKYSLMRLHSRLICFTLFFS